MNLEKMPNHVLVVDKINYRSPKYDYTYLNLNFCTKGKAQYLDAITFLRQALKSYFSMNSVLNKETLFHILACDFTDGYLQLLIHNSRGTEISEFISYLECEYRLWTGRKKKKIRIEAQSIVFPDLILECSAMIHTTAVDWSYNLSWSLRSYLYDDAPTWLQSHEIKRRYRSSSDYLQFLKVYATKKKFFNKNDPGDHDESDKNDSNHPTAGSANKL